MKEWLLAERGGIYLWSNGENTNYCLVVSSDDRKADKLVSILFASTNRQKSGRDVVLADINGETYVFHAQLVTYTSRGYLEKYITKMPSEKMDKIDFLIGEGLSTSLNANYKDLYDELLSKICKMSE